MTELASGVGIILRRPEYRGEYQAEVIHAVTLGSDDTDETIASLVARLIPGKREDACYDDPADFVIEIRRVFSERALKK